jgi:hypothetical protein
VTRERFGQGLTMQQYLDQMGMHKDTFLRLMGQVKAGAPGDGRKRNVLVITEDWCGDSLAAFPALARLVEGNADVEMRVFLRDRNPDVMDQYLDRGKYRSIPVFVFFDEQMQERARFTQRSPVPDVVEHLTTLLRA